MYKCYNVGKIKKKNKLKQQIMKCLICLPNIKNICFPIIVQNPHPLHQDIWKPFLCRHWTFIVGQFPQGLGIVFSFGICDGIKFILTAANFAPRAELSTSHFPCLANCTFEEKKLARDVPRRG